MHALFYESKSERAGQPGWLVYNMEELTLRERILTSRCRRTAYYVAIFAGFLCIVSCFILAALTYALFNDCEDCEFGSSKSIMVKSFRILATGLFLVGVMAIVLSLCCRHSGRHDLPTVVSAIPDSSLEKTPASTLNINCSLPHRHPESPLLLTRHEFIDYREVDGELTPPPTYDEAINLQWQVVDLQQGEKTPLSRETAL